MTEQGSSVEPEAHYVSGHAGWYLVVPALVLGIVGMMLLAIVASGGRPVVIQSPVSATDEKSTTMWDWVERASWFASFAGLLFAGYQVRALRQELSKKPKLSMGIGFDLTKSARFAPKRVGDWSVFDIRLENDGRYCQELWIGP